MRCRSSDRLRWLSLFWKTHFASRKTQPPQPLQPPGDWSWSSHRASSHSPTQITASTSTSCSVFIIVCARQSGILLFRACALRTVAASCVDLTKPSTMESWTLFAIRTFLDGRKPLVGGCLWISLVSLPGTVDPHI
ncbi:hypothetical protein L207DRAFT_40850 [Hyaloscypha variabilis F]|uniref:Uncharacterized protein n=1 Tax=Hyaloscypha variabilis (strain UAMH 11265 / GT02V1 / F) TaxID=1149755 RepID=A0A2J6RNQ2_HYAVF|nr:hypothetical protein L207DRAFT_40850 [Hyaloscypha variabilis F]